MNQVRRLLVHFFIIKFERCKEKVNIRILFSSYSNYSQWIDETSGLEQSSLTRKINQSDEDILKFSCEKMIIYLMLILPTHARWHRSSPITKRKINSTANCLYEKRQNNNKRYCSLSRGVFVFRQYQQSRTIVLRIQHLIVVDLMLMESTNNIEHVFKKKPAYSQWFILLRKRLERICQRNLSENKHPMRNICLFLLLEFDSRQMITRQETFFFP